MRYRGAEETACLPSPLSLMQAFNVVVNATTFWTRLALAVLATWRITHLFASEDGPLYIIVRIRRRLGASFAGSLMDCFQCLSFWVAAPMAFFVTRKPVELLFTWLALSGAACLLERLGNEPVVIHQVSETSAGGFESGLLRSETNGAQATDTDTVNSVRKSTE